jgi:hypothetical protein
VALTLSASWVWSMVGGGAGAGWQAASTKLNKIITRGIVFLILLFLNKKITRFHIWLLYSHRKTLSISVLLGAIEFDQDDAAMRWNLQAFIHLQPTLFQQTV